MQQKAKEAIASTLILLNGLLPYLKRPPEGRLINLPPQLCLSMVHDMTTVEWLSGSMSSFLRDLCHALRALDCRIDFLCPGDTGMRVGK